MVSGAVWTFEDNINTDLILPGDMLFATEEEQRRAVFRANRPGWVDQVRQGDVIVGGLNFGMGSSRPAARSLRTAGVAAVLAESINGLFFRNAVNFGLIALGGTRRACRVRRRADRDHFARRFHRMQSRLQYCPAGQPRSTDAARSDAGWRPLSASRAKGLAGTTTRRT